MAINKNDLEQKLTESLISIMIPKDTPEDSRPPVEKSLRDLARAIVNGIDQSVTKNINQNLSKVSEHEQKIAALEAGLGQTAQDVEQISIFLNV